MKSYASMRFSVLGLAAAGLFALAGVGRAHADDAFDALTKDLLKQAIGATKTVKERPPAKASNDAAASLAPMPGNKTPIPIPETAEDVEYDGADGSLEFTSASSVKQVAEFYRAAMKSLGWTAHPSVINKDTMVVLDFAKDKDKLSLTVMRMGDTVRFSANGPALVTKAAESAAADEAKSGPAAPDPELTVEESGGLPAPAPHSNMGSEATLFRSRVDASVPASIDAVVAFYRRELGKRSWKEQTDQAVVEKDRAELAFMAPQGPATLKLGRQNDETTIALSLRDRSSAEKSPLFPKPGRVRIMFGNMRDKAADITINNKTVKVAVGAGAKGPDGPTIDLPPGKYKVALKSPGQPSQNEDVEVGADEIWMVMVGPGGMMAVQAY